jgi:CRP-like cAMP-binding protein
VKMIKFSNYIDELADSLNITADIPQSELLKLQKFAKSASIKKGDYYLKAGEIPKNAGYITAGLMRLFYIDSNGNEINKHFCVENTLAISYSAFLLREESKLYIQALEDTEMVTIDYKIYCELLNSDIGWLKAAKKIADMLFILKEKRESELLLNNAQERYAQFIQDYPGLEKRISQYHIASYLGITPESLSRIRSQSR